MFDFLTFGRRAPENPLASLKAVTLWMKELPLGDVYTAHDRVVRGLVEFNESDEPLSKERLQILMHIDENAREMQQGLCSQYLINPRMSKSAESRLWNAVYSYYWEVTRGYHAFIMDYVANPGGSKIKPLIPLITARAIHDFSRIFKWRYFRYEKVEEKLWKRLHNLYHFAEFEEFERDRMPLYGTESPDSSCADEYMQALMLDTLNSGGLYPKQIELASSWLESWSHLLQLDKLYDPARHVFYVNLGESGGGRRIRKGAGNEMCRYWGSDVLSRHILQIKDSLHDGGVPAQLGLTEDCKLPACLELLEYALLQWNVQVKRVRRKHERSRVMKSIEVVNGLPEICAQLKHDNEPAGAKGSLDEVELSYEEMVDVRLYGFVTERTLKKLATKTEKANKLVHHERWVMENESEKGYGATVEEVSKDWVRLGKLVGLRPERTRHWRVGVVRRLHKLSSSQRRVGIELLSETAVTVLLHPKQTQSSGYVVDGIDAVDATLPVAAIYLPRDLNAGEHGSLVMDGVEYAMDRPFRLSAGGKSYLIRLKDVVEKGSDWLRAGFEVVSKSG